MPLVVFLQGVDFKDLDGAPKAFYHGIHKGPPGKSLEAKQLGLNETHYDIMVNERLLGTLQKRGFNEAILVQVATILAPLRDAFSTATKTASWNGRVSGVKSTSNVQ